MTDNALIILILGAAMLLPAALLISVLVPLLVAKDRRHRAAAREPLTHAEADAIYTRARAAALAELEIRGRRKNHLLLALMCGGLCAFTSLLPWLLEGAVPDGPEISTDAIELPLRIIAVVFAVLGVLAVGYAAIAPFVLVNLFTLRISLLTPDEEHAARERHDAAPQRTALKGARR
ncbi:MAG: hypothetical protein QM598_07135 [Protaetiibacter sp.]